MELEEQWKKYPVLHFDMSEMRNCTTLEGMCEALSAMLEKYETLYGTTKRINEFGSRFDQLILKRGDLSAALHRMSFSSRWKPCLTS